MPKSLPDLVESIRNKFRDFKIDGIESLIPDNSFTMAVAADLLLIYFNREALHLVFDRGIIREWGYLEGIEISEQTIDQIENNIKSFYFDESENGFRRQVFYKLHNDEVNARRVGKEGE